MSTARTYGQGCAIAHALDLVGERWALLLVRELLLGPKRFTDLRTGLPEASPDVLARRLRELERVGVVRRRKLGPPAGTRVYELTDWGRELESIVISLGRWGSRSQLLDRAGEASVDALMLRLRGLFDPEAAGDLRASYELRFGDDRFAVRVADGRLEVERGEAQEPNAIIETDPQTLRALLTKRTRLVKATREGHMTLTGDADAVKRLIEAVPLPEPAPLPTGRNAVRGSGT
jgi:DNA-binding HxlR family transcriptional regulator